MSVQPQSNPSSDAERPRSNDSPAPESAPKRRLRTPLILQLEDAECGAACLGIVLAHFGRWVSIEELREICGVGRDGCDAADLSRAARHYGLKPQGWRREPEHLWKMDLPLILYWDFSHFVVLEGFAPGKFYINDPANGHRILDYEEFENGFTGLALEVRPGPDFKPGGLRPGIWRRIWPWLNEVKAPLAFAMGCGLLLAVPALSFPLILSAFVDFVLAGQEPAWGGTLAAALVAAGGFIYLFVWLRQRCLRRIAVRLSITQGSRLMRLLFRLPMRFYAHRYAGDLTNRVRLIDQIAAVSSGQLIGLLVEIISSAAFLVVMLVYDPLLATVIVALGGLSAYLMRLLTRVRLDENRRLRREQGQLIGVGMFGLSRIDTLQAIAAENDFFSRWTGYQARELSARQRFVEYGYIIAAQPALIMVLANAAVLGLGGMRVIDGDMSVGMMMGFYVIAASFLQPIGRLVQFADQFQIIEADLQRVGDVLDSPEDPDFRHDGQNASSRSVAFGGRLRLKGKVELRNVTFGYQRNREALLKDFSLTINPGQRVAVVGPTGSGKSTLASLVAGLHKPWSGEILFDGQPRSTIPRTLLTSSVALVDQHSFLFRATVRENLTMWNPETPDNAVVAAGRDATIHEAIMARAQGYDSHVDEGGANFSGGQRQRLEIARALVGEPSVLVLDEATSALDAISEQRIDDALRRRGCSCLIVAHRLSTIRDSDLIIVLDRGQEVQRGTHRELMLDESGHYARLMKAN